MDLFPIFLKIAARPCIVIGAGNLAESKIESLQAAHARVTVIAPQATPRIVDLAAAGEIDWRQRDYANGDLSGNFLVVAATNVPAVNRAVYAEAVDKNVDLFFQLLPRRLCGRRMEALGWRVLCRGHLIRVFGLADRTLL